MKHVAWGATHKCPNKAVALCIRTSVPLLQFNHYSRIPLLNVMSRDQAVESLGGKRQLIFEDDAVISQVAFGHDLSHRAQRLAPRANFGRRRRISEVRPECRSEPVSY